MIPRILIAFMLMLMAISVLATETENNGLPILPAAGKVIIDGKTGDWDLSGGIFASSDVENQRDKYGVWLHGMYDADNLYLLAKWNDETPLNNPGSSKGDYGFAGDCLQFRIITNPDTAERTSHWTTWRDRDAVDTMDLVYGKQFNQGSVRNAIDKGAKMGFQVNADGKGYAQEFAIPWSLLVADGQPVPKAGEKIVITFEPNYTIGTEGRVSIKENFKPGIVPDRVFTFMSSPSWGFGTLEAKGNIQPHAERLSDGREFPVSMVNGVPAIDWTDLIKNKELKGFKTITFTMPEDGFISLIIKNQEGATVRQLLNSAFYVKGKHDVKWDGLTTMNWRTPGSPVPEGEYTWEAIWNKGIGLKFVGWADNSGSAPWDSTPQANWGGDHGSPASVTSDDKQVYLGWSGAEAGKALLACDLQGNVLWKNSRAGMAGAELLAVDNGIVYAQHWGGDLYRLDSKKGGYSAWVGSDNSPDIMIKTLWGTDKVKQESADSLDAKNGKLYLGFTKADTVMLLDGQTGKVLKIYDIKSPADIKAVSDTLVYVVAEGTKVLALNPQTGEMKPLITNLVNARTVAVDKDGGIFIGLREPDNQVMMYSADGKALGSIGRKGGRALLGQWTSDGMAFINDMTIAADGKLWVAENDMTPKRFSSWDPKTGKLVKEFFGPTTYGALGGAINPTDPYLMVGQGCEWRIDPKTGLSTNLGCFTRDGMENSRFGIGNGGRTYVAVAPGWIAGSDIIRIFERLGDADYKLRATFTYQGKGAAAQTTFWADENGDGIVQPTEEKVYNGKFEFSGWYMYFGSDMSIYSGTRQLKVAGFTACGAPKYDLAAPIVMPTFGLGSADGKFVMHQGDYNVSNGWNSCYDIATGKLRWTYPDNFVGVHGSHNAVPAEAGMIRGSYGPCGAVKLPAPIGNAWVIATNIGEWHILTESGYYLTRLFEPDQMKFIWPDKAVPGVSMNTVPCGMGGEDFGGSVTLADNGKLYVQAGKTGFWNLEVTGLETVKALPGNKITITAADMIIAKTFHDGYLQEAAGTKKMTVNQATPQFTGDLAKDFAGADVINYQKQDGMPIRSAMVADDKNLYLAWDVTDKTPWVNGAEAPEFLYVRGDTVDFQIGSDAKANKGRTDAVLGDMRLSIGSFAGKDTAVLFRKVWTEKKNQKIFSSGVIREYPMDSVTVVDGAIIKTTKRNNGYVVEASIPLASLNLKLVAGQTLRGDFGVTYSDVAGGDTALRAYWSNQATGIVNDEVFELMMEPGKWGDLLIK